MSEPIDATAPDSASEANGHGDVPLTLAARANPSSEVVRMVYEAYPAALETDSLLEGEEAKRVRLILSSGEAAAAGSGVRQRTPTSSVDRPRRRSALIKMRHHLGRGR